MICPTCGARNTAEAPWCTQCLQPLGPAAAEDTSARGRGDGSTLWGGGDAVSARHDTASPGGDRAFRSVDGRVEWRCPACETWNDLEGPVCTVCGQRLGASVTGEGPAALTERVGRARRLLWIAAGVGAVLMVVAVVLLLVVLRTGS